MVDSSNNRSIKIGSYDCNIRKKVDIVKELCTCDSDMLFLQEIILLNEESHFIFKIGYEFDATVLPSKCQCFQGRPSGGLAI